MDTRLNFEKRYRLLREIIETLILTVMMLLVTRTAVQNFHVDGMSMEPNLHDQELILVDKWSYLLHTPARGDVIVFHAPPDPTQDYVKRIIALPGDIVTIRGTHVRVNGVELHEPYVDSHRQGNPYPSFSNRLVPPGTYLVLGDNRNGSSDSRDWGCVPRENIIGRAALVYWPLGEDNIGLLPSVSPTFEHVPLSPAPAMQPTSRCPVVEGRARSETSNPLPRDLSSVLAMSVLWIGARRRGNFRRVVAAYPSRSNI